MRNRWWGSLLTLTCVVGASAAACGTSSDESTFRNGSKDGGGTDGSLTGNEDSGGGPVFVDDASSVDPLAPLVIAPVNQAVDVVTGQPTPTVQFQALVAGSVVAATWSVDRGEIGDIGSTTGVFQPKGTLGGRATVTASYRGRQGSTSVTVRMRVTQNGAAPAPDAGVDAGGGSGGNGGVGGEGPGGPVDAGKQAVLTGTPTAQGGLGFLYPYEGTVWPRGILAPLLQWSTGGRTFDAVYIKISEASYAYEGFFSKPAAAATFLRHPVPQDVWRQLAYSNAGEDVTVTLVFSEGGVAYGPITQKWKIAAGTLKGTVYYNSYGTALAKNHGGGLGGFARFGGATLAIRGSSTDPALVAGADGNDAQCRVCHSVSANGAMLITQYGDDYGRSSAVSLAAPITATSMSPAGGRFAWPAIFPDGSFLFSNSQGAAGGTTEPSALFALPGGASIAAVDLPTGLKAATPAFSPDGKHIAFNFQGGAAADQRSLATIDFDAQAKRFSNLQKVHTPAGSNVDVWPSYLPTNDGIVFQVQTRANNRDFGGTRSDCDNSGACSDVGVRAELWWMHGNGNVAYPLHKLNGVGHVPSLPNAHDADATLNYEPTVSPVPSGGYAWVVFTSRRAYGNVATINPFWSDPRYHDISQTPTTKKLWVAAIDLNAPPGTDPSHPAFYLPAQELLAGNSRGYWVVDPCRSSGASCETGDECCGGFCRPGGDAGGLVCTDEKPACAREFEKCKVDADCCADVPGIRCLNERCAVPVPR